MAERKAYVLRLPPELWAELQRVAADDLRSVNAEIEYLLRQSLISRGRLNRNTAHSGSESEE